MPSITISKKELKETVKESVREVLALEMMSLRSLIIPFISEKEQGDIEKHYGKPSRKVANSRRIRV
ncbi:MAG: hypothetical protein Q8K98_11905 [Bacteroidota bacterium]|nr:hypothetical protein [Bacteroidota bacterium]